ncbi:Aspartate-proton symporter [Peribacillus simplex]|nr:Aspartate-proton symporter [Peribacillus simplex]
MLLNLGVCFIFLFLFRGWGVLAEVISVATLISYIMGPVALTTLRRTASHFNRPFHLKGASIIAPCGFVFASLTLYWARWPLTGEVVFIIAIGLPIYFYYQAKNKWNGFKKQFLSGVWMLLYLGCMIFISYIGSEKFGGKNILTFGWDMVVIACLALGFYWWGVKSGIKTEYMAEAEKINKEFINK